VTDTTPRKLALPTIQDWLDQLHFLERVDTTTFLDGWEVDAARLYLRYLPGGALHPGLRNDPSLPVLSEWIRTEFGEAASPASIAKMLTTLRARTGLPPDEARDLPLSYAVTELGLTMPGQSLAEARMWQACHDLEETIRHLVSDGKVGSPRTRSNAVLMMYAQDGKWAGFWQRACDDLWEHRVSLLPDSPAPPHPTVNSAAEALEFIKSVMLTPTTEPRTRPAVEVEPTSPLAVPEERPTVPTADYCLIPPQTVRWKDESVELQPRLWRLLGFLLRQEGRAVKIEDAEAEVAGIDVLNGTLREAKKRKWPGNDLSTLNAKLEAVKFPWSFHVRTGYIVTVTD
jgi:hypothetical protein